jgi:hypothetical protein
MRVQRKYFFGLLYRKQWANIEGAPSSFSFAGHGVGNNVGLGFIR